MDKYKIISKYLENNEKTSEEIKIIFKELKWVTL